MIPSEVGFVFLQTLWSTFFGGVVVLGSAVFLFFVPIPTVIYSVLGFLPSLFWIAFLLKALSLFSNTESRYGWGSVFLFFSLSGGMYLASRIREFHSRMDLREYDALQSLGLDRVRGFIFALFPKWKGPARLLIWESFLYTMTVFTALRVLGGGPPNENIEVYLYQLSRQGFTLGSLSFVTSLSLQIILIGLMWFFLRPDQVKIPHSGKSRPHLISMPYWAAGVMMIVILGSLIFSRFGLLSEYGHSIMFVVLSFLFLGIIRALACWFQFESVLFLLQVFSPISLASVLFPLTRWFESVWIASFLQGLFLIPLFERWVKMPGSQERRLESEALLSLGVTGWRLDWFVRGNLWIALFQTAFPLFWVTVFFEVTQVVYFSESSFRPLSVWVQEVWLRFRFEEGYRVLLSMGLFSGLFFLIPKLRTRKTC